MTELEARHAASQSEAAEHEANGQALRTQLAELRTRLEAESKAAAEKQGLLDRAELRLSDTFKALSADGKGIEGVDPTKPIGAYVTLAKEIETSPFVVMVPIAVPSVIRVLAMG